MKRGIKATKKWWHEGKDHVKAKNIVKKMLKPYGIYCTEEERFPIDLHSIYPELWPKKSYRGYQADLVASRRKGHITKRVIIEIDGEYHEERKEEDKQRDGAILQQYGLRVVRLSKSGVLLGKVGPKELIERLGI